MLAQLSSTTHAPHRGVTPGLITVALSTTIGAPRNRVWHALTDASERPLWDERVLGQVMLAGYYVDPQLYVMASQKNLQLSLKHGYTPACIAGFLSYSIMMIGLFDRRETANRIADVAMEGVVTDEQEPPAHAGLVPIDFGAEQNGRVVDWETGQRFDRSAGRLYALFDTRDFDAGHVMVKWRQRETGQLLLMQQHRVRSGHARGFVWLQPNGRWAPGEYQVDVYSTDSELAHLATGRYVVN